MIPPPDGIPWLAWATVVVLLALIGGVPAWITARSTRGAIDEVREQVANTHEPLPEEESEDDSEPVG